MLAMVRTATTMDRVRMTLRESIMTESYRSVPHATR